MMNVKRGIFRKGKIVIQDKDDIPEGSEVIIVYESKKKAVGRKKSKSLYGIWRGKVTDNIDDLLLKIRSEWEEKFSK